MTILTGRRLREFLGERCAGVINVADNVERTMMKRNVARAVEGNMDRIERIKAVTEELNGALDRVRYEYHMTLAEMIGIIELAKMNLYREQWEELND